MMSERCDNPARIRRGEAGRARSAFTIIELLMVIGIVIILLSIIVVAVNAAMRTGQRTNTQALMTSISNGLVQFKSDIGYLPPVLGDDGGSVDNARHYFEPPVPPANESSSAFDSYFDDVQSWSSFTTLPEYLLGYGDARDDGYGHVVDPPSGVDFSMNENDGPLGIRHPGPDGYWGVSPVHAAWAGTLDDRREFLGSTQGQRYRQGRAYGPYIELRDERLLAAVIGQNPDGSYQTAFAGEANYDPDAPKAIVDYWGQPIRYFRKPYVPGMPNQDYRRGMYNRDGDRLQRAPTLADVIVLRPWRVAPGEEVDVHENAADAAGDTTATRSLQAATFGLLSPGPNRRLNPDQRVDELEFNRDKVVELGR